MRIYILFEILSRSELKRINMDKNNEKNNSTSVLITV